MLFRRITIQDKPLIDSYLARYKCYGSTFSMAYLASWDYFNFQNMDIAVEDKALVFRFKHDNGRLNHYLTGLCDKDYFPTLVDKIFAEDPDGVLAQLEMSYIELLDKDKYIIDHNIDYDEYLYTPSDLIELKGKKYHGKRGHIKKFEKLYPNYVYRAYQKDDRDAVMHLFKEWEEEKGFEMNDELKVINTMLDNFDTFGLIASIILVDDKVIGFTMGEISSSNVGIVHIEKGDVNYEGIYPTINMLFASEHFKDVTYINRQEDVGIEGLRKAKRSYYPVRMSEKCFVRMKKD